MGQGVGLAAGFGGAIISHEAALADGLDRYFTGQPCQNGHVAERRTNDKRCVQCLSEKWQRSYPKHADRYKATAKRHYQMKRELMKERSRRWYHENKERAKARRKSYYWQNRQRFIDAAAHWAEEDLQRTRATRVNARAKWRGIDGRISADDILKLMERQDGKCFCGTGLAEGFTVDHVLALANGGTNQPENIQLLCAQCNMDKGRKPDAEWKTSRGFTLPLSV